MPNHLAALGISQLSRLKKFNKKRELVAKKYNNFKNYPKLFEIQKVTKDFYHSYQMYSVIIKKI